MNETLASLDDLELFATVAQSASLSAAHRVTRIPLPTLSRRMAALEQKLGRTLFQRGPHGYALTADGRTLAAELTGLADTRHRVARWQAAGDTRAPVRITAGFWTSRFLAQGLRPKDRIWQPRFVPANARLDMARREADIGIRNAAPDHRWLARQQLAPVQFAVYGLPGVSGFVASSPDVPSQRWLQAHYADKITATASDPRLCLDLAEAGHGHIILPTFVGDNLGTLSRQSDPIMDLQHEAWLVAHQDGRHDPPVRAAIDEIVSILSET
ncbi:LysR family transcriptional regulator [Marivita sp. XM-24bin2]|uniref:LysR family transcriptional regulator n=1 Tax=unclassified Marivita TaxID=2632480 RepID=UPI000D7A073B|nr:LysR family transcriptional regulator [Marivita sp. XM-24bin2]MCR9110536.1 LysR family transcriptional regulator [Paracoccaceae bacterium]PWL37259.1 MAG: LysR family transcriptional regulator [Marivita sp. XM-24bin2]